MWAACAVVIALYACWMAVTDSARFKEASWGPDAIARLLQRCCNLLASLLGLSLDIVFDEGAPSLPYDGGGVVGAASPHSSFPVTQVGIGMFLFRLDERLATMRLRNAGASVLFYVPLLRELLLLLGVRDATRSNVRRLLDRGYTVALNPGGNYEMASASSTHEAIFCQGKLGFVRIALAAGKPILPLYAFGENQLFVTSSLFLSTRRWIARRFRLGIPIMFGRGGLPYGPPLPTHVTIVVGRPVECGTPNENPSEPEVEALFDRYLDEISRIWATHARAYLPPEVADRGLRIERIGFGLVRQVAALNRP